MEARQRGASPIEARYVVHRLAEDLGYDEVRRNAALPDLTTEVLTRFVGRSATLDLLSWVREAHGWT